MQKYILKLVLSLILVFELNIIAMAANSQNTGALSIAIKKYKVGNYTGCLQDTQMITKKDPSNTVAYYYMAMSYAQAGKKTDAIDSYAKVLSLKPNIRLSEYALKGKRCLETPEQCNPAQESASDLDAFIASPSVNNLSKSIKKDIEVKNLEQLKEDINKDVELDRYKFKEFKDYTLGEAEEACVCDECKEKHE